MRGIGWFLLLGVLACGVPAPPDVDQLAERARGGEPAAVEELVALLGEGSSREQRSRLYLVLLQVPPEAAAPIAAACDDADPVRREHALALAGNLRLAGTRDAALRALRDTGFPRRYVAAWTLGELGAPEGVAALVDALSQGDQLVARAAARALVKIGGGGVPALVSALPGMDPSAAGYALRVLGEIGDARASGALTSALAAPELRVDAAWALGKLGDPGAGPHLLELLSDPVWQVRLELCRALGLLEFADADPDLDRLRSADPVPAVREWAARSLSLLRGTPQTFRDARGEDRVPDSLYR